MSGVWISAKEVETLKGCTRQGAEAWIKKNARYRYRPGRGRGGKVMQVSLDSLPADLQAKYHAVDTPTAEVNTQARQAGAPVAGTATRTEIQPPAVAASNVISLPVQPVRSEGRRPRAAAELNAKQKSIALARVDLIQYMARVRAAAAADDRSLTKVTDEALTLYRHAKPETFKVLGQVSSGTYYRWVKQYNEARQDYRALAPQYGGGGGTSLTPLEAEVFLRWLLQPNHPKVGSAIRMTRWSLGERGLKSAASDGVYRRFARDWKQANYHAWVVARYGEKRLDELVLPYVQRDAALLNVGDILVADGHPLNFQVINPWTGKPGRAVLIAFLDWRSRYVVGFEIMMTETVQSIHSALRSAIMTLGRIPGQVLIDNGRAFKAKAFTQDIDLEQSGVYGLYGRLGIDVRLARAYNAKDKLVERFFETFTEWVERFIPSFVGADVYDKPAWMQRNEKWHKSLHNPVVPTIEQAVALVQAGLDYVHAQQHSALDATPAAVFAAGRGPGVDADQLNYLMMSTEIKTVYRTGVKLFGASYYCDALATMRGQAVIRYDIHDLSSVLVYTEQGELMGRAARVHSADPLLRDARDVEEVARVMKERNRIKKNAKAIVQAVQGRTVAASDQTIQRVLEAAGAGAGIEHAPAWLDRPALPEPEERTGPVYFASAYEKYEHLLKQETLTQDESAWIAQYEQSAEWEMIYGSQKAAVHGGK